MVPRKQKERTSSYNDLSQLSNNGADANVITQNQPSENSDKIENSGLDKDCEKNKIVTLLSKQKLEFNGQTLFTKPTTNLKNDATKRSHRSTSAPTENTNSDTSQSQSNDFEGVPNFTPDIKKKPKLKPTDFTESLAVAKIEIPSSTAATFPISYDNFIDIISNTYDNRCADSTKYAFQYTNNFPSLIIMLSEVYKYVADRSLKTRITKIINSLQKELGESQPLATSGTDADEFANSDASP